MFDIGWSELLVVLVVALVVVGPKDLPRLMRMAGRWVGKARAMADQFRASFDEMARQSELDDLRAEIEALRRANPLNDIKNELDRSILPPEPAASEAAKPGEGTGEIPPAVPAVAAIDPSTAAEHAEAAHRDAADAPAGERPAP